ncbi:unnamed protein product [Caenorhabditis auriculariae]|uniref:Protein kinase domain-containing protein n=1 Tax=Caenorhabditis auriculariae TaxID=2777116 RepID=A0A8S1HJN8_9PELO|nr:unnamed protein product [Caenorhabditis auriculariae]
MFPHLYKSNRISYNTGIIQEKENADDDSYQARIRSIKIWRKKNTCTIDGIKFETINELLTFHKITPIVIRKQAVKLKTPIKLASWEFTHKQVELSAKILGGGAFGEVRLGTLDLKSDGNLIRVAIKTLKITSTEQKSQNKALMAEARLSRVLIHPNVLRTYGVAIRQEPVYLISELCPGGSLYSVLRDPKQKHTTAQKVAWCVGSARGVEYLHANKYIHRDLAVRNVLLSEDRTAKISDFGMARQGDNYVLKYVTKTPVKYLAPETLKTFVFSPKSDVFTFGILIWEVFHDAAEPHAGLTTQQVIAMSKKGVFLTCNEKTPEPIRRLISQRIFTVCPENRCNITEVIQRLEKVNEPEPKEVGKK